MTAPPRDPTTASPGDASTPRRAGDGRKDTVVRASSGWQPLNFRELWEYRELIYFLSWRDIKVRYKQTLLGAAWAVLLPVAFTAVFSLLVARYADLSSGGLPYPLFAYTGFMPWIFLTTALNTAGASVVASERVVTRVYFPRLCIPFAAVSGCLADLGLAAVVLVAALLFYGVLPGITVLLMPIVLALLFLAALGLGAFFSALMVAYRDVRFVLPFVIQLLLFATPSIYVDVRAGRPRDAGFSLLDLHPLDGLIATFRAAAVGGEVPWNALGTGAVVVVALFFGGCYYFRRVEDSFADII